jgi:CDP-glucose 4,6-dehydratase
VSQLVNKVLALMDSKLEPEILNQASNEIRNQYLSAAKARDELNWHPLYEMEQGLQRTIDWYRNFFGLVK